MPKGVYEHKHIKPKQYDPALVARVRELYENGATQTEISEAIGLSQKVVWKLMKNHNLIARIAAKRNQSGERNAYWRGDEAGYAAFHKRVEVALGRPAKCDMCGTEDPSTTYDWANLTGNYRDINDYKRMCRSCHAKFDDRASNINKKKGDRCP